MESYARPGEYDDEVDDCQPAKDALISRGWGRRAGVLPQGGPGSNFESVSKRAAAPLLRPAHTIGVPCPRRKLVDLRACLRRCRRTKASERAAVRPKVSARKSPRISIIDFGHERRAVVEVASSGDGGLREIEYKSNSNELKQRPSSRRFSIRREKVSNVRVWTLY